ncbi:MAG TPA: DUF4129 domain-containing protein [Acidimicrobiales bacterium]
MTWLIWHRLAELPPPRHDADEVRRRADEILSRPEYRWDDEPNFLERLAEWIAEQLGELVGASGGGGALPTWVGWLVLLLLAGLVGFLLWRFGSSLRRDPATPRPEGAVVVSEPGEQVDWAAEAERHEAAGRWRDGLRCRYRALIGELAERRAIPDLVGRTAGELARDVAASCPPAASAFAAATELFERACYGGEPTGPAERDRFAALAADVLTTATPDRITGDGAGDRPLAVPT